MASIAFNANLWQSLCQDTYDRCGKRAQTPMHHLFLFSQSMDEELLQLDSTFVQQAISIAQGFGYESSKERTEYIGWYTQHLAEAAMHV